MQTNQNLLKLSIDFLIVLISIIFIIPSKFKAYPLILLFVLTILFIYNKKIKFSYTNFFNISILFFIYLFSVVFSTDLNEAFYKLSTMSSLFAIPIIIGLLVENGYTLNQKLLKKITYVLSFSLIIFSVICFWCFYPLFNSISNTFIHYSNLINIGIGSFSIHPIYLSIYIGVSILLLLDYLYKTKNIWEKFLLCGFIVFHLVLLSVLMRKGPIIFLIITSLLLINKFYTIKKILIVGVSFILVIFISIQFIPKYKNINRFEELIHSQNTNDNLNSTYIRKNIWACSFELFLKSPYIGFGLGNVQNELNPCLKEKKIYSTTKTYNSHNQFISILLVSGISGLIIYLLSLFKIYRKLFQKKNFLAVSIITFYLLNFLTENVLEREHGVIPFSFFLSFFLFYNNTND